MSEGAKTALILGGVGVIGYVLYTRSQAVAAPAPSLVPVATTVGAALAPSPGAPISTGVPTPATSGVTIAGHSVSLSTIGKIAAAPVYYPTVAVIGGAKAVGSFVSSGAHALASIF